MQKTSLFEFLTEAIPSFYKYKENSQKNGKIWINKVSVWY